MEQKAEFSEGPLTINRTAARAFINYLNQAIHVETNPLFQIDRMSGMMFQAVNQAHLSVLQDLVRLVTDKTEVMAEYDRMLNMVLTKGDPNSSMAVALQAGRPKLEEMLQNFDRGH